MSSITEICAVICALLLSMIHLAGSSDTWDGHFRQSRDTQFLSELQLAGGPLCDFIGTLQSLLPNYKCSRALDCDGYEKWLTNTNVKLNTNTSHDTGKIVLSIGHNGFGNQIFQHVFAQNVAQFYSSALYITSMNRVSIGKRVPQHTAQGAEWISKIADPRLLWDTLPESHRAKGICASANASLFVRGVDFRSKHRNATEIRDRLIRYLSPSGDIKCLVIVGYFQDKQNQCLANAKHVFKDLEKQIASKALEQLPFSSRDIVIHLRCPKKAFSGFGIRYIGTILNETNWERLYVVKPPGACGGSTHKPLFAFLQTFGSRLVVPSGSNSTGLEDFLLLASAKRLILDKFSTFSFWAGYFSVGTEVHVDMGSYGVFPESKYVYHDEENSIYFGKYDAVKGVVSFQTPQVMQF